MTLHPLQIFGKCAVDDAGIYANIIANIQHGLPELSKMEEPHQDELLIVGSGPSVAGQLETIRALAQRFPIVAIRDAHDWLIANGIVPQFALNVDPLESGAHCFRTPHKDVKYMIASQSHPVMLASLKGFNVELWHAYMKSGQNYPPNRILIDGSTTSGLRALRVFYVLGYRTFHLFGLDSCLDKGILRVNGAGPKPHEVISEIKIDPEGETFYCNPGMALQAQNFQEFYEVMQDCRFFPYGHGLIQAIILKRQENRKLLDEQTVQPENGRVSFIHAGNDTMASYRYRAYIPAVMGGMTLNDLTASTLIFSKPLPNELMAMWSAKRRGQYVVVDFCDDHFDWMHYRESLRLAHALVCGTEVLRDKIRTMGREPIVIPDPYEFEELPPHCNGTRLLWFGHQVNRDSLQRILPDLPNYVDLHVVSNFGGAIPWSRATMIEQFQWADIVILPATEPYRGANRAVEAIRQGCFVVAEPHPAWNNIPGIWIGNIKEGIEWSKNNPKEANFRTSLAASHVRERYSPKTVAAMWRNAIQRPTTSVLAERIGMVGSMSI